MLDYNEITCAFFFRSFCRAHFSLDPNISIIFNHVVIELSSVVGFLGKRLMLGRQKYVSQNTAGKLSFINL